MRRVIDQVDYDRREGRDIADFRAILSQATDAETMMARRAYDAMFARIEETIIRLNTDLKALSDREVAVLDEIATNRMGPRRWPLGEFLCGW
ncbi:hypothetical protein N8D56_04910 [Devosia sp. A8/3-2]|nr:hypothetical protein N8D56_04910 [Devosia sp. A8/3-2]